MAMLEKWNLVHLMAEMKVNKVVLVLWRYLNLATDYLKVTEYKISRRPFDICWKVVYVFMQNSVFSSLMNIQPYTWPLIIPFRAIMAC